MKAPLLLIIFSLYFVLNVTATSMFDIRRLKQLEASTVYAGVSKVDSTLPIGVPLAGYNHGDRRVSGWPLPKFTRYTAFMTPSTGVSMPLWARCLILKVGTSSYAQITVDAIGADGSLLQEAYTMAKQQGFDIPLDNVILSASHTHSGPGALTSELLWSLAPATDLVKSDVRTQFASSLAACLVEANLNIKQAKIGSGTYELKGVSHNRRSNISPYVSIDDVDTQLAIIRVDDAKTGEAMATVWNFAIHGTCYGPNQMSQDGDIMGLANILIEKSVGGFAMFVNSDAGDVAPSYCDPKPDMKGSHMLAEAVAKARESLQTFEQMELQVWSKFIPFGPTHMNLTLERVANCTHGGPIDICSLCSSSFLDCHWDLRLDEKWVANNPKFTAVRMKINGTNTVMVTSPGEPITELGKQIKEDAASLGFDQCYVFGYSNEHMGYFTTPDEYDVGGYESQLTFWGINTSNMIREGAKVVMQQVKP